MSTKQPRPTEPSAAPPERWVSRADTSANRNGGPEARLAALIRAGEPQDAFGAAGSARVWARLRHGARPTRHLAGLRWSVVGVVLLTSGAVIGAVSTRRWWTAGPAEVTPSPRAAQPRAARVGHRATTPGAPTAVSPTTDKLLAPVATSAETSAPNAPATAVVPAPTTAPVEPPRATTFEPAVAPIDRPAFAPAPASPRRTRASRDLALATPSSPPAALPPSPPLDAVSPPPVPAERPLPASSLSGETPLVGEALTRLRQQRDARGALATLDLYEARYPRGVLRREAEGARVDALLLLGRDDEALAVLRGLTLKPQGRDQELRVIRGELAAKTDCASAVEDFSRVLAEPSTDALGERALHGRAACHARLHDDADAKRDLTEYLRRFPAGRFADEAHRALRGNRGAL
jgi:hypothetical protein